MYIQKKSVRTVLPSSTVVVGVPLILTTSMVTSIDAYDVGCEMQKKRIECAIMIRAAMAED